MELQESNAKLAMEKVFREAMGLNSGDTVLLVVDNRTYHLHRPACDGAIKLGLYFLLISYPVHLQREFTPPLPPIYNKIFNYTFR